MRLVSSPCWTRCWQVSCAALAISAMLASFQLLAQAKEKEHPMEQPTFYRVIQIDGLSIFYREAGAKDAPTLLLLHGLPSSSRMFEPLFARLSDRYHLVAPDYPGFGHSDWPDPRAISRWIRLQMRLPRSSEIFTILHVEGCHVLTRKRGVFICDLT